MKKVTFIFLIIVYSNSIFGQSIELKHGQYFYRNKVEKGDPKYTQRYLDNEVNWRIRAGYRPKNNSSHSIYLTFCNYSLYAFCYIGTDDELDDTSISIQHGTSRSDTYQGSLGYGYMLNSINNRLRFEAGVHVNIERTYDVSLGDNKFDAHYNDDLWSTKYSMIVYSWSNPGIQVLPELSLAAKFRIWSGLNITLSYSYRVGFRPSQYVEAEYSIDGKYHENALFYTDGTGALLEIGLLYDFQYKKCLSK